MTSRFILAAALFALPGLGGSDDAQLTPREMFYFSVEKFRQTKLFDDAGIEEVV